MLRVTAILGLASALVAVMATGASALEPQPPEELSGLSAAEAILFFAGIPLLVVALITALVLLPGTRGARGAAAGSAADGDGDAADRIWINPGTDDATGVEGDTVGGRGARW